jgi:NAD(P)-dependent dehydrogenase (short-subunit alcohol dehydrogenase family)
LLVAGVLTSPGAIRFQLSIRLRREEYTLNTHQLFDLKGRVAMVTGAAGNLGGAIATAYADAGADLLLIDIDGDGLHKKAKELDRSGQRVRTIVGDIADIQQIKDAFEVLDSQYGRIDILANVAGEAKIGKPEEISLDDVEYSIHSIATSRFFCCQQAGRRMLKAGRGSIISICSLAGVTALGRGHIAYSMAMGAVAQMTRELSTEWSSRGVRVNAIVCGQILNKGLESRMRSDAQLEKRFLRGIPVGRLGEKDDIQGIALLLASDASSFITGALIPLDGGNLAKNAGGSHPGMPEF